MLILLADDHKLIRDGLRPLLSKVHPRASIVEAGDFDQALELAGESGGVDLALLDLRMPGMNGLAGITRFKQAYPQALVVVLSAFGGSDTVLAAIEAGAVGFIPKTIGGQAFISALHLILAGEVYLPYSMLELSPTRPVPSLPPPIDSDKPPDAVAGDALAPEREAFTLRERSVMPLLVEGLGNKAIARKLGLQEPTVKACLRTLYRKIGATSRAHAVTRILALDGRLR